jgi:hypothetical protein
LQKISVACRTCDVSESFYSSTSVRSFRVAHLDHDVVERNANESPEMPDDGVTDGSLVLQAGRSRLLKVLVELVMLPSYSGPVFTITGIRDNMKSAFVQVIPPNQVDQVNETLGRCKFLDSGSSDLVYVWEPEAVSFSEDARLAMSFGDEDHAAPRVPQNERSADPPGDTNSPPPVPSPEAIGTRSSEEEAAAVVPVGSAPEAAVLLALPVIAPVASPETELEATLAREETPQAIADVPAPSERKSTSSPSMTSPEFRPPDSESEVSTNAPHAASESSQAGHGGEGDDYLLVSKSWYVEPGPKNMSEAVRISRLLRPFRWKVEPAYTIGVIVDDLLSVESATGEIGGDMTRRIEDAGYELSRVIVDKGRPVAWFMKESRT